MLHFISTPFLLFATLIFFSWIHISMPGFFDIHTSWLFFAGLIFYYTKFDTQLACLFSAILLPLILVANFFSSYWLSFPVFFILFVSSALLQLLGHFIEGEQPATVDHPKLIFTLPLIMMAEILCNYGYRQDLLDKPGNSSSL